MEDSYYEVIEVHLLPLSGAMQGLDVAQHNIRLPKVIFYNKRRLGLIQLRVPTSNEHKFRQKI